MAALDILTKYQKFTRTTYDIPYDFSGVQAGEWVKISGGSSAAVITQGDNLSSANLAMVISRMPKDGNIYEGHDTAPAGAITAVSDPNLTYVADGVGVLASVTEGDYLTVSSAADEIGKLKTAANGDQVVAKCEAGENGGSVKTIKILSPFILNIPV